MITTLRQVIEYTPGAGCSCHATSEYECACDVDWTSKNEHFLEWKLTMYSYLIRNWFIEYYEHSVTKETTATLSKFTSILNEPLTIEAKINPNLEQWIDEEIDWRT